MDTNFAVHHCNQSFDNRKPQASTTVFARRRTINLSKGIEQPRLCFKGNAYACVFNIKANYHVRLAFGLLKNTDNYLAFFREFDGIANEIGEDLTQSSRVTAQSCGQVRR